MGVKGIVLKYHGDITLFCRQVVYEAIFDIDTTAGDALKPSYHPESGRLTAATRTNQDDKFLVLYGKVEIVYCNDFVEMLANVF
jgi:hypothetical protein